MASVRHILGFERNPAVLQLLQEQYSTRREIDRELGINCTVRFFTLDYGGPNSDRASIQYDYLSFADVQDAQDKRLADARWTELNVALAQAGLTITFSGIATDQTPD